MPVSDSFYNVGHEISGKEDSDHVKLCGSNWVKIKEALLKITSQISTMDPKMMKIGQRTMMI